MNYFGYILTFLLGHLSAALINRLQERRLTAPIQDGYGGWCSVATEEEE